MARGVIIQCGACRSLVSVNSAVVDGDRAGLFCEVCGAMTWLPFASAGSVRVVDVTAAGASVAPNQLVPGLASAARANIGELDDGGLRAGGLVPGLASAARANIGELDDGGLRAGGLVPGLASAARANIGELDDGGLRAGGLVPGLASAARAAVAGPDDGEGGEGLRMAESAYRGQPLRAGGLVAPLSTALQPMASAPFTDEQRGRVRERLRALADAGTAQQELSAVFERLLAQWHNDAAHKQFLQRASMHNELAFAGQHYRAILGEIPNDAVAKKAQGELIALAMASMSPAAVAITDSASRQRVFLILVIILVTGLLCGAIVKYLPRLLTPEPLGSEMPPSVLEER
jgi:hypothetical protein